MKRRGLLGLMEGWLVEQRMKKSGLVLADYVDTTIFAPVDYSTFSTSCFLSARDRPNK